MPRDAERSRAELLRISTRHAGTGTMIVVDGELDRSVVPRFTATVAEELDTRPRSMAIETYGLSFVESSGLRALLHARHQAHEAGVPFRISHPSAYLRRLLERTGLTDLLLNE